MTCLWLCLSEKKPHHNPTVPIISHGNVKPVSARSVRYSRFNKGLLYVNWYSGAGHRSLSPTCGLQMPMSIFGVSHYNSCYVVTEKKKEY